MKGLSTKPHARDEATDRIAGLSPAKQALLELRLKKSRASALAGEMIALRSDRESARPLSFAQQRLWFLDQLEPNSSLYNISTALRLTGALNVDALQKSLITIIERHEALRTTFACVDGEPVQLINANPSVALARIDLSAWTGDRDLEVRRILEKEARRSFDLSSDLMLRSTLIRLSDEENVLLLVMHHIASDGWSIGVLFRELGALYDAFCNDRPSPLHELPIQYADYAIWQRQWLQGDVLEKQLSYWKNQLNNISTLQLPTDRPRPMVQSHRGASQSLILSKELTESLRALSRKERASLFMTLLAALQLLLHRLTGQDDIAVGSPIAGRNRSELEHLIGFFLNTLVLRTDLSGSPTFTELLARVRQVSLDAYAHQDIPFEKLLEELRPKRDLSRSPLFQVFFNMLHIGERPKAEGVKIEAVSMDRVQAKFDLTIYVRERDGDLHFNWVYNSDLFDGDRIQEMLRQYEKLLSQIVEHPAVSVHSYSFLTPAAQELLPSPVGPLRSDWAGSVHDRFSLQATYLPDHPAITDPHESWTYRELNSRANQLAHYMLENGIQKEDVVAVYANRSAALAWALLGILKAGAAFLILDPAQPTARLRQYLGTAKPRGYIRLTAAGSIANELKTVLEQTLGCKIALPPLSELRREDFLAKYPKTDPKVHIEPDDLAYISFTSGSTGEPKGVLGRHGPLSHFLPWQAEKFALGPSDRFSLFSGLSHDPLHREIFTALWVGAAVHVPEADIIGASGRLVGWMARQAITFAHLTPPLARLLSESALPETELPLLRYAFLVGDKLTWSDVERLRRLSPNVTCVNYYGSTETQRAVSYYQISPQAKIDLNGAIVPVGQGMPNVQLLILTRERSLAGLGEVGEIYMRSPHLARGYLADESLTQARFITNPFTRRACDRLYRTGDLGRYLADGSVEILGRIDEQVKVRGFRIELGEIQAVLTQHSAVRDCVVTTREVEETDFGVAGADGVATNPQSALPSTNIKIENRKSDKRLVAYVLSKQNPAPPASELRRFLNVRLPDYMVPSAFVVLDDLPLTPNGKLDYRSLPAPNQTRDMDEPLVAPQTPLEEMLAQIWRQVLGVQAIGIKDNFFEIGGHSLLAVRLFVEIERKFKKRLPLSSLFERATIQHLASVISQPRSANDSSSLIAIQPHGSKPPFFCIHEFFGDVLCYMNLARHLGQDQPFYALQARGLDDGEEPFADIVAMAKYYIDTIRTVQPQGPYALGGLCFGGIVAFEMAQQLRAKGEPVALVALLDSAIGLNVGRVQWWWRFFKNLPWDFRPWVTGALQLTGDQWLELIKIKTAAAKGQLAGIFSLSAGGSQPNDVPARLKRIGDVFQFSDRHQRVARAQYRALKNYKAQTYAGRLTLFRARMQPFFSSHDPHKGWSRVAGGGIDVKNIPANHLGMLQEPHVQILAKELRECLADNNNVNP